MMRTVLLVAMAGLSATHSPAVRAFVPGRLGPCSASRSRACASAPDTVVALRAGETDTPSALTEAEQKVYGMLEDIHASDLPFRIVVVGNGAILESTQSMGPTFKLEQSPKSGKNLVTFASEDASFEFHLMTADVSKVVLSERESPATGDTMRVLRMINTVGAPVCSLIVADQSKKAVEWYATMLEKYGNEIQL